jgi:two-component sensor histidine kinase
LADKLRLTEIADEFLAFIGDPPLMGHNAGFDVAFLNAELKRADCCRMRGRHAAARDVQGIAMQSFSSAGSKVEATEAFQQRLAALASAHDLLTREHWESASLDEIIGQAVRPHGDEHRFYIKGPEVRLPPKSAVAIAMGIHELCTNAVKYGALSKSEGRISITWSIGNESVPKRLRLRWEERGGPEVVKPKGRGFGSRLVERLLAQDLDAEIVVSYAPEGVICSIHAPSRTRGGLLEHYLELIMGDEPNTAKRILLVEDEALLRFTIAEILTDLGH